MQAKAISCSGEALPQAAIRRARAWAQATKTGSLSVTSAWSGVLVRERRSVQLSRLVPVHTVRDLTAEGPHVARELALIKVAGSGEKRIESLRLADIFRARVIDSTTESFVFEMTGATEKLDAFIALMEPLGLVDVSRTGVVAIARGTKRF